MTENEDRLDKETVAAYRKIKEELKNKDRGKCPDEETLVCYLERRLDESEIEEVERHLSLCSKCTDYVVTLNNVLHTGEPGEFPEVPKGIMNKAKDLVEKPEEKGLGSKLAGWLSNIFPFPMPVPVAIGSALVILLALSAVLYIYRSGQEPGKERVYVPFELTASLIGKSHVLMERGVPEKSFPKVLVKDGGVLRSHDNFQVRFKTNKDAYVYILIHDSRGEVEQLFPHPEIKQSNRVTGGTEYVVPSRDKWFWLDENTGTETIYVLTTEKPVEDMQAIITTMKSSGIEKVKEVLGSNLLATRVISFKHTDDKVFAHFEEIEKEIRGTVSGEVLESTISQDLVDNSQGTIEAFLYIRDSHIQRKIAETLEGVERSAALESTRGLAESLIYKKASPAVVVVVTEDSVGSGSILNPRGDVITNWHVVRKSPQAVVVLKPPTGIELREDLAFAAEVVKVDALTDLALLRIKNLPKQLAILNLGSMKNVEVGQDVHAIGHPEGQVWSYTKGIISQIRPDYEWPDEGIHHKSKVIQTQTPINPGSSGGPLLNDQGEIIGINSFYIVGQGLNFAVSVDVIQEFLKRKVSRLIPKKPLWGDLPVKFYIEEDLNKDGRVDIVIVDIDGDKAADVWIFDDNQDNKPDYLGFDRNRNEIVDTVVRDLDKDGVPETYQFDFDEDGVTDLIGLDHDADGEIDQYFRG